MNEQMTGLASLGRYEDNRIAHVADGEMIIPPLSISLATKRQIFRDMLNQGINPANYIVGSSMGINPNSGLPEFFLKKLVKKIIKPVKKLVKAQVGLVKKVVKSKAFRKLAPIAANFIPIPGVGPLAAMAIRGAIGGVASGGGIKGALLGAAMGAAGGAAGGLKPGMSPVVAAGTKITPANYFKATSFGSNPFTKIKDAFAKIKSGGLRNIFGGLKDMKSSFAALKSGGSGGITSLGAGSNNPLLQMASSSLGGSSNPLVAFATQRMGQSSNPLVKLAGQYLERKASSKAQDSFNPMLQYASYGNPMMMYASTPATLVAANPSGMTREELLEEQDRINRAQFGLAGGMGGLAGLTSYFAARDVEKNPLVDIRENIRPDLRPAPVYGQGGFDLGFRGYAEGGEVLDMRDGGESEGPGTGTSDDIPAMLSDGEFVMTASANKGVGGYKISKSKGVVSLTPSGKPDRKKGARNMMNLMKTFEKYNEANA
tara:strand:- start:2627 stop:4084 length:1458 start_codon:yes stop_codon:yes gene_type:complete